MTNDIEVQEKQDVVRSDFYDKFNDPLMAIEKLGAMFANSGMFGCKTQGQGAMLAFACLVTKTNPIELKEKYHLIEGNLSMKYDSMLAELRKQGGDYTWIETGDNEIFAEIEIVWKDKTNKYKYTKEMATKAGLTGKDNWRKYPGNMLRARCVSMAMHLFCPEIVKGKYTPEEIAEFSPVNTIINDIPLLTSAEVVKTKQPQPQPVQQQEPKKEQPRNDGNIESIFTEEQKQALIKYFVSVKWLKEGQQLNDLSEEHKQRIVVNGKAVLSAAMRMK